jgi:hypothetical protein
LRVYQGGGDKIAPIPIKVTINDAAGKVVFTTTETVATDRFTAERAADYQFRLPLATLKTGEYLLTFETTVGKTTRGANVRFSIR